MLSIFMQSSMMTGDLFIEWSLLIRAIIFGVLFTLLGIVALRHKSENKPKYINFAGWFSIITGVFNFFMAAEWTYVFFIV